MGRAVPSLLPGTVNVVGLANGTQLVHGPGTAVMHIFAAPAARRVLLIVTVGFFVGTALPPLTTRLCAAER